MRKTLLDHWIEYRDKVYPGGIVAKQNRECQQAFMAGAFVSLSLVAQLSKCPDDNASESAAAREIGSMLEEATEWCRMREVALNQPRN